MAKLKLNLRLGKVATGLFEQLNQSVDNQPYEKYVCIGARRDNPKCDSGGKKFIEIFLM